MAKVLAELDTPQQELAVELGDSKIVTRPASTPEMLSSLRQACCGQLEHAFDRHSSACAYACLWPEPQPPCQG